MLLGLGVLQSRLRCFGFAFFLKAHGVRSWEVLPVLLRFLSNGQQDQMWVLESRFWQSCLFPQAVGNRGLLSPDCSLEGGLGSEVAPMCWWRGCRSWEVEEYNGGNQIPTGISHSGRLRQTC